MNLHKKKDIEEITPHIKKDRRLLSHIPDVETGKPRKDRRIVKKIKNNSDVGTRYEVDIPVVINLKNEQIIGSGLDLSDTGILIEVKGTELDKIINEKEVELKFRIPKGALREGCEYKVTLKASPVRYCNDESNNSFIGLKFERPIYEIMDKRHWKITTGISTIVLSMIFLTIILMRANSIEYFRYLYIVYGYSILVALYLLTRYLFAALYKSEPIDEKYTPGVSIIIPCFNEETWIQRTIISCLDQDYPIDKLEVIVVDDCSNDNSKEKTLEIIDILSSQDAQYDIKNRLKFIPLNQNSGKRIALVRGAEIAKHPFVTFVDSDSFLEPNAIRNLIQPFKDPKVGGVTGRTDVENAWTNSITKMQVVRYYIAFRIFKAAESYFDCVTCLSGPISCYRKELINKYKDDWLNQRFLGQPATFGDDRSMTNFILKHNRTVYQDTAVCRTIVPSSFKIFIKQQMRWKRSWLRESIRAGSFMYRKEPFQTISFYIGFIAPVLSPILFIYNFVYVSIVYKSLPIVFMKGLILTSLLMGFVYLFLRKSKLWIYGIYFYFFYEFILLWQMPIACVTFWKSTWGTRNTKEDIAHNLRKKKNSSNFITFKDRR